MKALAFSILLAVSGNVFAAGVELTVNPGSPVLFDTDFRDGSKTISAPWFKAGFVVTTDQDIVLKSFRFDVFHHTDMGSATAYKSYSITLKKPVEVKAGQSYSVPEQYFADCPYVFGFPHHVLDVSVYTEGWVGTLKSPVGRLDLSKEFKTQ